MNLSFSSRRTWGCEESKEAFFSFFFLSCHFRGVFIYKSILSYFLLHLSPLSHSFPNPNWDALWGGCRGEGQNILKSVYVRNRLIRQSKNKMFERHIVTAPSSLFSSEGLGIHSWSPPAARLLSTPTRPPVFLPHPDMSALNFTISLIAIRCCCFFFFGATNSTLHRKY